MFSKVFLKDASERAVKAFAAAIIPLVSAGKGLDLFHLNWGDTLGVGVGAAVTSLLLSLASYKAGQSGTASAIKDVTYDVPLVGKHRAL